MEQVDDSPFVGSLRDLIYTGNPNLPIQWTWNLFGKFSRVVPRGSVLAHNNSHIAFTSLGEAKSRALRVRPDALCKMSFSCGRKIC